MLAGVCIARPVGSVVDSAGTPDPFVLRTAELTGARNPVVPLPA
jgi:hypothetical protein